MSRRKKAWSSVFSTVIRLLLVLIIATLAILQSSWFKNKVRARIVAVAETATGGRVEIGTFDYNWRHLTVELAPFVVHGKERPGEAPFLRADRVRIGLKIVSLLKRDFDLVSLLVERPQVSVVVNPDGTTNVPEPKSGNRWENNFANQLLDLTVQHFELRDGFAEYNTQRIPLDLEGDRLQASISYQASGPRYLGAISARRMRVATPRLRTAVTLDVSAQVALERSQFQILHARAESEGARLTLDGLVRNLSAPGADFDLTASAPVTWLNTFFGLPLESTGAVSFEGKGSLETNPFHYRLEGKLAGRELAIARNGPTLRGVNLSSRMEMTQEKIQLADLQIAVPRGRFRGAAHLNDFKSFSINGTVTDFPVQELAKFWNRNTGDLNGALGGSIQMDGEFSRGKLAAVLLDTKIDSVPGTGGVPLKATVGLHFDQRAAKLQFSNSEVTFGATNATVSGTLGESLNIHLVSGNLNDFAALYPLFDAKPPDKFPVVLHGGEAKFDGVIAGPLTDLRISGKTEARRVVWKQQELDHVAATVEVDKSVVNLYALAVDEQQAHVVGQARMTLSNWKTQESSALSATLSIRNADITKLLQDRGDKLPITGALSATAHVTGTLESPLVSGNVDARNVTAYDEHFDSVRGDVTMTATALEVAHLEARAGESMLTGSGAYNHLENDFNDGFVRFDISSNRTTLARIHYIHQLSEGLAGDVDLNASGTAKVVSGVITLASLNGHIALKNATYEGRAYGGLEMTASTKLPVLSLNAKVDLPGVQLQGNGEWRLDGDYPGQAHIQIPRVTFATLHDLWPGQRERKTLPFEGFMQGEATITGSLNSPSTMSADRKS